MNYWALYINGYIEIETSRHPVAHTCGLDGIKQAYWEDSSKILNAPLYVSDYDEAVNLIEGLKV